MPEESIIGRLVRLLPAGLLGDDPPPAIEILRAGEKSWLSRLEDYRAPPEALAPAFATIEAAIAETAARGGMPFLNAHLDPGVLAAGGSEIPHDEALLPRARDVPAFCAWLAVERRPAAVLEFTAGFGVTGMHFMAALEANGAGTLFSFEPNAAWYQVAHRNIAAVGRRFVVVNGAFEDNPERVPPGVDIALVDAVHSGAFVLDRLELVLGKTGPRALVLIGGIDFSDDMRMCWLALQKDDRFGAAAEVAGRLGVLELA